MLAQSALRETGGGSPASEALAMGPGGKGKKSKSLVGLFSNILSQAQNGLAAKGGEGAKGPGASVKATAPNQVAAKPKVAANASVAGKPSDALARVHTQDSEAPKPASGGLVARAAQAADSSDRRVQRAGKRVEGRPGGEEKGEPSLAGSGAAKRRQAKPKTEGAPEEGQASQAALAGFKLVSANASPLKAKGSQESAEAELSIKAGKKAEGQGSSPTVTVLDMRSRSAESKKVAAAKEAPKDAVKAEELSADAMRETKTTAADSGKELVRELSLDARGAGGSGDAGKAEGSVASGRASDFQSMLADRLREAWNGEIVKSAHIVLRDGDAGTIRLRLRPESLGNVKIELNLSDNNISGRIMVESDEAKSAFEKNMNELADAFKQGGFDSARLEVSVGGGSGGWTSGGDGRADAGSGPFFSERLRSTVGSAADHAAASGAYARRGSAVDILA
jgi:flagellar hook-length control protein FliK